MLRMGALEGGLWFAVQDIRLQLRSTMVGNPAKQFQSISYCFGKLTCSTIISILKFSFWLHASMVPKDWFTALLDSTLCLDDSERRGCLRARLLPKVSPHNSEIG